MSAGTKPSASLDQTSGPAAATRPGNVIIAPVTRDQSFHHYTPDRFSIVRTASSAAERFEIRLHSIVHREISQQLAIVPGKAMQTVGRDIRIEVSEQAVIDLAWPQLLLLRDELNRAIAAAAPVTPDEATERLTTLTAQIAVAEGQLSHLAWPPGAPAPTAPAPSSPEIERLIDRISLLVDRLEPRTSARRPAADWTRQKVGKSRTAGPNVKAYWGGAVVATILGLVVWAAASEDLGLWPALQLTSSPHAAAASASTNAVSTSSVRDVPPPSAAPPNPAPTGPLLTSPAPASAAPPAAVKPVAAVPEPVSPPAPAAPPPAAEATALAPPVTEHVAQAASPPATITAQAPPDAAATTLAAAPTSPVPEPPAKSAATALEPPSKSPATTPEPPMKSAATAPDPAPVGVAPPQTAPIVTATTEAPAPHVAIHVTAQTWVRVRDGGGRIYVARVLKAGETWPVPAVAGLVMTSGNSGSTFIVVDGVSGPALGSQGEVRTEKLP